MRKLRLTAERQNHAKCLISSLILAFNGTPDSQWVASAELDSYIHLLSLIAALTTQIQVAPKDESKI